MCFELFHIHPRCGHPQSVIGQMVYCLDFHVPDSPCNDPLAKLKPDKHWEYLYPTDADRLFLSGEEEYINTIRISHAKPFPSFCWNCHKGYSEPLSHPQRRDLLDKNFGDIWRVRQEKAAWEETRYAAAEEARNRQVEAYQQLKEKKRGAN
jgi:hypothetical protein